MIISQRMSSKGMNDDKCSNISEGNKVTSVTSNKNDPCFVGGKTVSSDGTGVSTTIHTANPILSASNGNDSSILTCNSATLTNTTKVGGENIMSSTTAGTSISISSQTSAAAAAAAAAAASIRTLNTGGQSTQVRVVMPTSLMSSSMIKQLENTSTNRTQISTVPPQNTRSIMNASLSGARPAAGNQANLQKTTTLGATTQATTMGLAAAQRLVTPVRSATLGVSAASLSTLTGSTNLVRGTPVNRQSPSPVTTVMATSTSSTWMTTNAGQVQLIRAISHQPRQRIVSTQSTNNNTVGVTAVALSTPTSSTAASSTVSYGGGSGGGGGSAAGGSGGGGGTGSANSGQKIQSTQPSSTQPGVHNQSYVASVLPPRPQQATLVYSSSMTLPQSQGQFITSGTSSGNQRFTVATTLAYTSSMAPRQIRPISIGKSNATSKLNTTNISIRTPNHLVQAPLSNICSVTSASGSTPPRSSTVCSVTGSTVNIMPTGNLSTARIIQLPQQGANTQQIIGSTARLSGNVLMQPLILNTIASGKISLRSPVTKVQPSLTITQLGISKLSAPATTPTGQPSSEPDNIISPLVHTTTALNVSNAAIAASSQNAKTINGRTEAIGNVIAGVVQPMKSTSTVAAGKLITKANNPNLIEENAGPALAGACGSITSSVCLSQRQQQQQHAVVDEASVDIVASNAPSANPAASALTLSGAMGSRPFLPPGSTLYYESIPASSAQLTFSYAAASSTASPIPAVNTIPMTTFAQNPSAASAASTAASGPTAVTSSSSASSAAASTSSSSAAGTVPSATASGTGAAAITAIPACAVKSAAAHMQTVSVRLSANTNCGPSSGSGSTKSGVHMVHETAGQQILLPRISHAVPAGELTVQQGQNVLIPIQTSIKLNTNQTGGTIHKAGECITASPIRCAKNLGPTLHSMDPNILSTAASSAFSVGSATDRLSTDDINEKIHSQISSRCTSRPGTPNYSDGSTTVSANSSPSVEQQIQDHNIVLGCIENSDTTHFNPINEISRLTLASQRSAGGLDCQLQNSVVGHFNDGEVSNDFMPLKKPRRSTNDSQLSMQSLNSSALPAHIESGACTTATTTITAAAAYPESHARDANTLNADDNNARNKPINATAVNNKENAKPIEYRLRRRRNCTLLNTYKQTWKSTQNHFIRYSDVRPRDERRPTVNDLSNQSNVLSKINGWKIYHLRSQMEDLCEHESGGYEHLCKILTKMESCEKNPDVERVNDLLKGNIQRSKIIVDGVLEAQNQIMKIFDHKTHVCDIITRCASKRNFKKRDKN